MDTPTIIQLRECRDKLRNALSSFRASRYSGTKYGDEQEYTAKGIAAGADAISTDISALLRTPAQFVQRSTTGERAQLANNLERLYSGIDNGDLDEVAATIDEIKPLLRGLGVRYTDERLDAFGERINQIQKDASALSQEIADVEEIKAEGNKLKEEISNVHQELTQEIELLNRQKEELAESINLTIEKHSELDALLSADKVRSEQIEQILTNSKSHEEIIDNFSTKVTSRESQLEKQEVATQQYKEKLEEFKAEREDYLSEARELIESAKLALEYKTAEGLSAAFTEQYNKANEAEFKNRWLISAGVFVLVSVGLGIWLTVENDVSLEIIVARISLLPILIAAAWFSARQYVKQKNIEEDYAYKAVLAKSIVGFSEQLSTESDKGEDYSYFIKSVLTQMHQDPLRKHTSKDPADIETVNTKES